MSSSRCSFCRSFSGITAQFNTGKSVVYCCGGSKCQTKLRELLPRFREEMKDCQLLPKNKKSFWYVDLWLKLSSWIMRFWKW